MCVSKCIGPVEVIKYSNHVSLGNNRADHSSAVTSCKKRLGLRFRVRCWGLGLGIGLLNNPGQQTTIVYCVDSFFFNDIHNGNSLLCWPQLFKLWIELSTG